MAGCGAQLKQLSPQGSSVSGEHQWGLHVTISPHLSQGIRTLYVVVHSFVHYFGS